MHCNRCKNEIGPLSDNVSRKIELTGADILMLLCPFCRVCYICYRTCQENGLSCRYCGFYYHEDHSPFDDKRRSKIADTPNNSEKSEIAGTLNNTAQMDLENAVCAKCTDLHSKTTFDGLLGPEIPVLERHSEEISKETIKKITEIVKKNRLPKSTDGIKQLFLGDVEMTPLFSSPYPEEYIKHPSLYICSECLEYFSTNYTLERHRRKCKYKYPPGRLLYSDMDSMGIFEVEGGKEQEYCQSLCLLAKMFLDHKTLYYDVEPFLFYIIGEIKEDGFQIQGYFSKERGEGRNNLSCIVVLPPYRKLGLGSFLIDFSYYLTRKTVKPPYTAGPEQPLSSDGERAYFTYWANCILRYVYHRRHFVPDDGCFESISLQTGVSKESISWVYNELSKRFGKQLTCTDFIMNKGIIKKIRRMKKGGSVQQSIDAIDDTIEKSKEDEI